MFRFFAEIEWELSVNGVDYQVVPRFFCNPRINNASEAAFTVISHLSAAFNRLNTVRAVKIS